MAARYHDRKNLGHEMLVVLLKSRITQYNHYKNSSQFRS